jgi:hypothetical protein
MKLRRKEFGPVHRSIFCRGRESTSKPRQVRMGIQRIEDPHHPKGISKTQVTSKDAEAAQPEDC